MDYTTFKNSLYDIEQWLERADAVRKASFEKNGPWYISAEDLLKLEEGYADSLGSLQSIGNFIFKAKKELKA